MRDDQAAAARRQCPVCGEWVRLTESGTVFEHFDISSGGSEVCRGSGTAMASGDCLVGDHTFDDAVEAVVRALLPAGLDLAQMILVSRLGSRRHVNPAAVDVWEAVHTGSCFVAPEGATEQEVRGLLTTAGTESVVQSILAAALWVRSELGDEEMNRMLAAIRTTLVRS